MPRDLPAGVADESVAYAPAPVLFVHLDVDGDELWASTLLRDVTITLASDPLLSAGATFTGAGKVGEVSDMVQSADGTVSEVTLTLHYVDFTDQTAADLVNTPSQWSMRAGVVWLAFLVESTGALTDPIRLLTGRMVHVTATDGAQPGITVKLAAKSTMDGQRFASWKLATADQETFYTDDKALELVPQLAGAAINFGVPDNTARTSGPGNFIRADRQYEQQR